jgi:hypothetical protein
LGPFFQPFNPERVLRGQGTTPASSAYSEGENAFRIFVQCFFDYLATHQDDGVFDAVMTQGVACFAPALRE